MASTIVEGHQQFCLIVLKTEKLQAVLKDKLLKEIVDTNDRSRQAKDRERDSTATNLEYMTLVLGLHKLQISNRF